MVYFISGPAITVRKKQVVDAVWSEKSLNEHFRRYDADKNGKLSFAEVQEALKKLGSQNDILCYVRAASGVAYADGNDDECINLHDQEIKDLVRFVANIGFKIEPASSRSK